jgi:hypothetical protein
VQKVTGVIQRKKGFELMQPKAPSSATETVPPIVYEVLLSPGKSLDPTTRAFMEPRFGHDFSKVRVHAGERASDSARAIKATAYAVGQDIVFGAGQYAPGTNGGKKLIAHELKHVIQQQRALSFARASLEQDSPSSAEESEADEAAEAVLEGRNIPPISLSPEFRLQLKGPEEKKKEEGKASEGKKKGEAGEKTGEAGKKKCDPSAVPYYEVIKIPDVKPGTLGHTKADKISFNLESQFIDGTCKVKLTEEPKLTFKYFVYTKPGTYLIGKATPQGGKCTGKEMEAYLTITAKIAERIKQGEIEHCKDLYQAFDLSYGRYLSAAKNLEAGFPAKDNATCASEIFKRLAQQVGIETAEWKNVADCLIDKTLERDKTWHAADFGKQNISKDCKKVTLTPDPSTTLTEIGKHPSSEVIKGCGEK